MSAIIKFFVFIAKCFVWEIDENNSLEKNSKNTHDKHLNHAK